MIDYDKLAEEFERGVNWASWEEAPEKLVLENRLIALRQLEAIHRREADKLHREQDQLGELLAVL
jgi:hypothetical protein